MTMQIRYKKGWKPSVPIEDAKAAIDAATDSCGNISPDRLVADAKPKGAPLHDLFTWSNAKAADKWRVFEARRFIGRIEVVIDDSPAVRAYHSVEVVVQDNEKPKQKSVFRSISEIMEDPSARDDLLRQAINDALRFKAKYHALSELAQVFAAIDETAKTAVG